MVHALLRGVVQVGELHQFVHLVIGGQRGVAQDIRHIGGTEHIELAPHLQIVELALHDTVEIDECLAECHAAVVLLGIDQLIVLRPHPHVHEDIVEVGKIYVAIDVQRIVIMCENLEVLEEQLAAHHAHGVVAEAQLHAVRHAHHICRVEIYLSVHLRLIYRSLHGHLSVGIAFEAEELLRDESVDERKRHVVERHRGINHSLARRCVCTYECSHLVAIAEEHGVNVVTAVGARHINEFSAHIAHITTLVCHLVDGERRR